MYPVFPDETKHVIEYLTTAELLQPFAPRVAGDLKGYTSPARWITVQETGGSEENPVRVAAPRVDINVYAESRNVAKTIARNAVAAMKSMKNMVFDDAVVIRVETSTPANLTDPVNSQPRYVFDATIYIRPR
jgi:hypothetical protein